MHHILLIALASSWLRADPGIQLACVVEAAAARTQEPVPFDPLGQAPEDAQEPHPEASIGTEPVELPVLEVVSKPSPTPATIVVESRESDPWPQEVTPSHVYARLARFESGLDRLLEHGGVETVELPRERELDLGPLHAYQMVVACTNETVMLFHAKTGHRIGEFEVPRTGAVDRGADGEEAK